MTESSMSINQIIIEVRKNIRSPEKNGINPVFNTKYADLNAVLEVVNEAMPEGTTFTQPIKIGPNGETMLVLTIWTDTLSEDVSSIPLLEAAGNKRTNELQMMGQAITYLRRYQLKSFFGLKDDDNDGNRTSNISSKNKPHKNRESDKKINTNNDPISEGMNQQLIRMIQEVADIWGSSAQDIYDQLKSKYHFENLMLITQGFAQELLVYLNGMKKAGLKAIESSNKRR